MSDVININEGEQFFENLPKQQQRIIAATNSVIEALDDELCAFLGEDEYDDEEI